MQIFELCNKQGRGISKTKTKKFTQEAGRGETDPLRPTPAPDEPGRRMTFETGWKALCDPLPKPEKNNKNNKSAHICFDQTLSFLCLPFQNRIN